MSDMSVSFARRRNNYHRHDHYYHDRRNNESNALKKTVAAGVALGGGYATKKILSKPIDADAVTLKLHAMDLGKQTRDYKAVDAINKALEKEGATITEEQTKTLAKMGIDVSKAPEGDVKGFLKTTANTMRDNLEASNRGTIAKKTRMLKNYDKAAEAMGNIPPEKQTGKIYEAGMQGLENMKKEIAQVFHLETDKDGKLVKELDTKSMLAKLEEQGQALSDSLRATKAKIKDKIADIKLLNPSDEVAKAFKAASKDKNIKAIVAGVATALGLFYLLKPEKRN